MASFALLSVLGNGSGRIAAHCRFPIAAFQAGSILVLWDYVRDGGRSRKFVPLRPGQRCAAIFYTKDAQHVVALSLSQGGHPSLTVWRTADGTQLADQRLSDEVVGAQIQADFHDETSQIVVLHGSSVVAAYVVHLDGQTLRPHVLSHGHLNAPGLVAVRLLEDGRHFVTGDASAVQFWSFMGRSPQSVLKVELNRQLRGVCVLEGLVFLLPEKGAVLAMNFQGQRQQLGVPPPPGAAFTAIAATGGLLCLGTEDGRLMVYMMPRLDLSKQIPSPSGDTFVASPCAPQPQAVVHVALGIGGEYACACFADGSFGVAHVESAQYVAFRVGHASPVRSITLAPRLDLPVSCVRRLVDGEGLCRARSLAFLTLASRDLHWVAWPSAGAPARGSMARQSAPTTKDGGGLGLESYVPRRGTAANGLADAMAMPGDPREPLLVSAAAFYPQAHLSPNGGLEGAYVLLAGTTAGSLHLLESEGDEASTSVGWRIARVRPPPSDLAAPPEATPQEKVRQRLAGGPGNATPAGGAQAACRHVALSRCGRFATACFESGHAELLHFPMLARALVLQRAAAAGGGAAPPPCMRALFAWQPCDADRPPRSQDLHIVAHTANPREVVLYEAYPLGEAYAKAARATFVLPAVCQAAGGEVTDFCLHPSQLYLLVAASLPAADARALLLVHDLWDGQLLKSVALFGSLLVTPQQPLRPTLCPDASGAVVFCSSGPTRVGSLDAAFRVLGDVGGARPEFATSPLYDDVPSDVLRAHLGPLTGHSPDESARDPGASVISVLDFCTGECGFQTCLDACCLASGTVAHDPTQLLVGAHDGTTSVWRPPVEVCARMRSFLEEAKKEVVLKRARRGEEAIELFSPGQLEEAVALYWAAHAGSLLDWSTWGRSSPADVGLYRGCRVAADQPLGAAVRLDPSLAPYAPQLWSRDEPKPTQARPFADVQGGNAGAGEWGEDDEDVVVQARRSLRPTGVRPVSPGYRARGGLEAATPSSPSRQPRTTQVSWPSPRLGGGGAPNSSCLVAPAAEAAAPAAGPAAGPIHAERLAAATLRRAPEPAELLVAAPELREEFGVLAEHFEDPLPSDPLDAGARARGGVGAVGAATMPRRLEGGRPLRAAPNGASATVAKSVAAELDRFDLHIMAAAGEQMAGEEDLRTTLGDDMQGGGAADRSFHERLQELSELDYFKSAHGERLLHAYLQGARR